MEFKVEPANNFICRFRPMKPVVLQDSWIFKIHILLNLEILFLEAYRFQNPEGLAGSKEYTQSNPPGSVTSYLIFILLFEAISSHYYIHTHIGTFLQTLVSVLSLTTSTAAPVGSLSKLTRRPRGGGQQANCSDGLKAK